MKTMFGSGALARGLTLAAVAAAVAACDDVTVVENRPTEVVLTATPTSGAVGDSISFRAEAQGSALAGVTLDFGDGTADTLTTQGPQTIGVTFGHRYAAPAEYEAVATVHEGVGRTHSDTVLISIAGPSGG